MSSQLSATYSKFEEATQAVNAMEFDSPAEQVTKLWKSICSVLFPEDAGFSISTIDDSPHVQRVVVYEREAYFDDDALEAHERRYEEVIEALQPDSSEEESPTETATTATTNSKVDASSEDSITNIHSEAPISVIDEAIREYTADDLTEDTGEVINVNPKKRARKGIQETFNSVSQSAISSPERAEEQQSLQIGSDATRVIQPTDVIGKTSIGEMERGHKRKAPDFIDEEEILIVRDTSSHGRKRRARNNKITLLDQTPPPEQMPQQPIAANTTTLTASSATTDVLKGSSEGDGSVEDLQSLRSDTHITAESLGDYPENTNLVDEPEHEDAAGAEQRLPFDNMTSSPILAASELEVETGVAMSPTALEKRDSEKDSPKTLDLTVSAYEGMVETLPAETFISPKGDKYRTTPILIIECRSPVCENEMEWVPPNGNRALDSEIQDTLLEYFSMICRLNSTAKLEGVYAITAIGPKFRVFTIDQLRYPIMRSATTVVDLRDNDEALTILDCWGWEAKMRGWDLSKGYLQGLEGRETLLMIKELKNGGGWIDH